MKKTLFSLLLMIAGPVLAQNNYIVHEWGTFTSVQGGDGRLRHWHPLATSRLPGFVHQWYESGSNLLPTGGQGGGKGGLVTLQRLETPVDYFYSAQTMNADVSVDFPRGFVTEWYPQASQIGPSRVYIPDHASPAVRSQPDASLAESRVTWRHLTLTPPGQDQAQLSGRLPLDQSGANYFAARETDADYVQTSLPDAATGTNETEKFLFYRGAGSFATPLQVTMDGANQFTVANNGGEGLAHLFFVRVQDGYGEFATMDTLPALEIRTQTGWDAPEQNHWQRFPLAQFQEAISDQMAAALVSEGLYEREARAMVNTWRDSWFAEAGTRVLYILPRDWTDATLPMTLNPRPAQLVRVMVGRAEVISPQVQAGLLDYLTRAKNGDAEARRQASLTFKQLGRFAEPALYLSMGEKPDEAVAGLGFGLMIEAAQHKN